MKQPYRILRMYSRPKKGDDNDMKVMKTRTYGFRYRHYLQYRSFVSNSSPSKNNLGYKHSSQQISCYANIIQDSSVSSLGQIATCITFDEEMKNSFRNTKRNSGSHRINNMTWLALRTLPATDIANVDLS